MTLFHCPVRALRAILVSVAAAACLALTGCATAPETGDTAPAPRAANRFAHIQTELGIGYLRENKPDLAWQRLTAALEADPEYSTAHYAMGLLNERLGNPEAAEKFYRKAVELEPLNSSAQTNYGSFLCRTGRYEEGEQRFLRALQNSLYENPAIAYTNAGLCAKQANKMADAERYFRSALKINPNIPAALAGLSEANFALGNYMSARAHLQRFLQSGKSSPAALMLGVRIERELGDQRAERAFVKRLVSDFPQSKEADEVRLSGG